MPKAPNFNLNLSLGRRRGAVDLVGLDIQPGYIAAVQAKVNGSIVVEHAAGIPLPGDTVREGEVLDEQVLTEALRELFSDGRLGKRVRLGIANQRTVLRTLDLPPVTDRKELAAAVRFQAEDQVPMPLGNAVLDFQSLGMIDTPSGQRQRVIVVAAQRDMVERLVGAVRAAGLRPEGVDLSAFALIRSLYRPSPEGEGRVLYLNVGGLTNMAIADGTICRFTRVVGGGLEAMAAEVAERRQIPLVDARKLLGAVSLLPEPVVLPEPMSEPMSEVLSESLEAEHDPAAPEDLGIEFDEDFAPEVDAPAPEAWELAQSAHDAPEDDQPEAEIAPPEPEQVAPEAPRVAVQVPDADVRAVLENGIHEIVSEVRNSLDFHRSQDGGGHVSHVVLSGPALEMPGFAELLESDLGIAVHSETVYLSDSQSFGDVSAQRLAVAAGLAAEEVHP
jgi:type IV pilus assembly protein PilM